MALIALLSAPAFFFVASLFDSSWRDDVWAHLVGLIGVSAAGVNVVAGLVVFLLDLVWPSPRTAALCRLVAILMLASAWLLVLAAALASTSGNPDARSVFLGAAGLTAIAAAPLALRSRIPHRVSRLNR